MSIAPYVDRRARLIKLMGHGIAFIPTAPEVLRNADTHYDYRHDSNFYYLSGFPEPEAVLVLIAGQSDISTPRTMLFCREKNLEREIWDGYRYGPDAAREQFGFDEAYPITQLDEKLVELLGNQPALFYPLGHDTAWDQRILKIRSAVQEKIRSGIRAPDEIRDVRALINEMRLFKDAHELDIMRRAAAISTAAHRRAMQFTRPDQYEYQVEAELLHEFCRHGARHPAYTSIVAGGANACVLHYVGNNARLKDGDFVIEPPIKFASDSAELPADGLEALAEVIGTMRANPKLEQVSVTIGAKGVPAALTDKRAKAVLDFFNERDVDSNSVEVALSEDLPGGQVTVRIVK